VPHTFCGYGFIENHLGALLENLIGGIGWVGKHDANGLIAMRKSEDLLENRNSILYRIVDHDRVVTMLTVIRKHDCWVDSVIKRDLQVFEHTAYYPCGVLVGA
jgi:hypothetical protein